MVLTLIAGALGYFAPGAILSGAGFTAAGIKAGSIAAGIQGKPCFKYVKCLKN